MLITVLNSFYGMQLKPDVRTQRYYKQQIEKSKQILGDRYLLANHVQRKEAKDEKVINLSVSYTDTEMKSY